MYAKEGDAECLMELENSVQYELLPPGKTIDSDCQQLTKLQHPFGKINWN